MLKRIREMNESFILPISDKCDIGIIKKWGITVTALDAKFTLPCFSIVFKFLSRNSKGEI